ncbi:YjcZ family sporulation protein [Paenibacillus sepulcri]|uniref:YjcZ family sporulation protein n=1 Tax=Paenibacillus sepulcri TaxID=359917 RepID=A0ABS7C018_9BACL|nr:YjcZ family sporulation protein [Paenibacillus sepulcri]
MSDVVGGVGSSFAFILVLFILLVIIACSCGKFGY